MAPDDLQVDEESLGDGHLIVARGDFDHATAPLVADALRRVTLDGGGHVVVHMSETGFLYSAGTSTLLNGLRRLPRLRRKMFVVCPPGPARRVFEVLGLVGTCELFETRGEALARV